MDAHTKRIFNSFKRVEEANPKKSTEWCVAMACDQHFLYHQETIEYEDVIEALALAADER